MNRLMTVGRVTPVLLALALAGCGGGGNGGGGGPPPGMKMRVKASPAAIESIEERFPLVASIAPFRGIHVQSEIDGTVASIHFTEGQRVKKDELLLKLDTRKLEAMLAEAEANFKLAESNRERAETMFRERTISAQEHDQVMAAYSARKAGLELMRQQLKDSEIRAPFEGLVGDRLVSPGQVITRATRLTALVDIDPVKIDFRAPERLLGQLRVGQSISFRVPAYPGEEFHGEVYFIDNEVDAATRTVLVKATNPNEDNRLRPGMFGNLDLVLAVRDQAVVIPETALVLQGDQVFVFIVDEDGAAQMRPVVTGARMPGRVEIREGLSGGETVIREGLQKLGPGSPVQVVPDAETAPEAQEG
ncbi:MAG TPA: efflux RND transporter periplasmic adaptor subunit [Kiritimatiellia bacterium]|nr:efflux RND transporter periplasmic adaptor subunit [Kiritimatiellia bacterium]